jgi:hypothetical protein
MNYAKPEVALLAHAIAAIESGELPKRPLGIYDADHEDSNGAYEADE